MAEEKPSASNGVAPSTTFTPSQRIAELSGIDKSVSSLLSSAAEAVGILSNSTANVESAPKTLASAQARFTKASSTYFSTLSDIEVSLRRQVYALEEAGLVAPGNERDAKAGRTTGGHAGPTTAGPLDPSWLNARADDGVDVAMRRELLDQAKDFLHRVEQGQTEPQVHDTRPIKTEATDDSVATQAFEELYRNEGPMGCTV